jgi:plastocyanin
MSRRPHPRVAGTVRGQVTLAAAAAAALLAVGAPAASAAEVCGTQAAAQPLIDHLNTAHLERSPLQQVRDVLSIDSYVLAHTVLIESMIAPLLPTAEGVLTPLEEHINSAHLERSPMQQIQDLVDADQYVLAHTVLVESMLAPVLEGCAAPAAPTMPPAHGGTPPPAAPPPAQPSPPPAPPASTQTVEIHNYAYSPKDLAVGAGTSVTWNNHDADAHTVTQSGGSSLKSRSFGKDQTFSHTFTAPGRYAYVCSLHPQMKGTVTVQ